MLAVGDTEHARTDDAMSPNKTQFHQKLFFFDYVVPLLPSPVDTLVCGSQDMEPTVTVPVVPPDFAHVCLSSNDSDLAIGLRSSVVALVPVQDQQSQT